MNIPPFAEITQVYPDPTLITSPTPPAYSDLSEHLMGTYKAQALVLVAQLDARNEGRQTVPQFLMGGAR